MSEIGFIDADGRVLVLTIDDLEVSDYAGEREPQRTGAPFGEEKRILREEQGADTGPSESQAPAGPGSCASQVSGAGASLEGRESRAYDTDDTPETWRSGRTC